MWRKAPTNESKFLQVKSLIWPVQKSRVVRRGRYSCSWHYQHIALLLLWENNSFPVEGVYKLRLYPSRASPLSFVPLGAKHLDCTKFRRVRFADLLKVTIATNTNTKSLLMVSRYSNMSLTRHIVTVSISVGGQTNTKSILMVSSLTVSISPASRMNQNQPRGMWPHKKCPGMVTKNQILHKKRL